MIVLLRWLVGFVVLGLVLGIGAVAVYLFLPGPGPTPRATVDFAALDARDREALAAQGEAVARAADCAACHTAEGGPALAGGLPLESPLGRIYSTNITPSADHGIADWTADDLYSAMVWGIARGGKHLYPAMPYPSYHAVTRADVDALWVWLMAQRPVDLPNRPSELPFPFNIRPAIAFWNFLFLPEATSLSDAPAESEEWRRGRYLVDVLGHCGECHTPRNLAYAKTDEHLQGGVIEGATAPDITPSALAARGFTREDLAAFLRTGLSPQGVMTFNMYPVLEHSSPLPVGRRPRRHDHLPDGRRRGARTGRGFPGFPSRSPGRGALPGPLCRLPRHGWRGLAARFGSDGHEHHRDAGRPAQPGAHHR